MKEVDVDKLNAISSRKKTSEGSRDQDVPYMIDNILNIYDNYLNAYQMHSNIEMVQ